MNVALSSATQTAAKRELHSAPDLAHFSLKSHASVAALCFLTLLLKSLIFAPISWWPLSFICLVPWILAVVGSTHAPRVYLYTYLWAAIFFFFNMRWLIPAAGVGGYLALSLYLAVYFPLMACPIRHAVRRRNWPLAMVVPIVWVGCEMLRAVIVTGFPWFYLSHSVYLIRPLIQISDLVGAYGVSFVIASINGLIVTLILARLRKKSQPEFAQRGNNLLAIVGVVFIAILLVFTIAYGIFQLNRDTTKAGPRIALLQGDFLSTVDFDSLPENEQFSERDKMFVYVSMMKEAAKQSPDLFLLPESPWVMFLNPEERDYHLLTRDSYAALYAMAKSSQAYIVTGCATKFRSPNDLVAKTRIRNSASVFFPDGRDIERYDKVHLVPFGEYVPFRFGRLRFLYLWLNKLMPFDSPDGSDEFSMFPGEAFHTYTMTAKSTGQTLRFGIPICYEDVVPYVAREFVCGGKDTKQADFLLNISNDGWFGRGIQQPQHLAISAFRAVENRVGIARAVNTGGSAFIEPSGKIHDVVKGSASDPLPKNVGYSVANVSIDSRFSFYSRYGDWFAWLCALGWLLLYGDYWWCRARTREVT